MNVKIKYTVKARLIEEKNYLVEAIVPEGMELSMVNAFQLFRRYTNKPMNWHYYTNDVAENEIDKAKLDQCLVTNIQEVADDYKEPTKLFKVGRL